MIWWNEIGVIKLFGSAITRFLMEVIFGSVGPVILSTRQHPR